jgi:hypothetical protein
MCFIVQDVVRTLVEVVKANPVPPSQGQNIDAVASTATPVVANTLCEGWELPYLEWL